MTPSSRKTGTLDAGLPTAVAAVVLRRPAAIAAVVLRRPAAAPPASDAGRAAGAVTAPHQGAYTQSIPLLR